MNKSSEREQITTNDTRRTANTEAKFVNSHCLKQIKVLRPIHYGNRRYTTAKKTTRNDAKLPKIQRLDVIVVTASSGRSDVRGNVGLALSVDVRRSIVDSQDDVGRGVDGIRVVDDVSLDDGVDGDDGGDGFDGFDDISLDLDTLGVVGELVIAGRFGGSTLEGVGGSILGCALA